MYSRFSKAGKIIVLINIILTVGMLGFHSYNMVRMKKTEQKINNYMEQNKVIKETAIRELKKNGEDLFLGDEFFTLFGFICSVASLILSFVFIKNGGGVIAVILAVTSLLTSLVGGLLILYMLFTGKYDSRLSR